MVTSIRFFDFFLFSRKSEIWKENPEDVPIFFSGWPNEKLTKFALRSEVPGGSVQFKHIAFNQEVWVRLCENTLLRFSVSLLSLVL